MDHAFTNRRRLITGKRPIAERVKTALIVITLLAAWATVSEMDYQDAIAVSHTRCMYRGV